MLRIFKMQAALASVRSCLSPGVRSSLSGVIRSTYARFEPASVVSAASRGVLGQRRMPLNYRSCIAIRTASSSSSDSENSDVPIALRSLESPVGQFLVHVLENDPHLMPAAVEQLLQQLHQSDHDSEKQMEEEVKANERRKALEDIMYALVIKKFMDANVVLVPSLESLEPSRNVDTWNTQVENLEKLHSSKAYEAIQYHVSLILGDGLSDLNSVAEISKIWVGQIYAGSIIAGYLTKRADERKQLEQTMKILPEGLGADEEPRVQNIHSTKSCTYVRGPDIDKFLGYPTFRSKAAMYVLDKQTKALFGTCDSSGEEVIIISGGGLKKLLLEAATFGSILWDVESFVDSKYPFVES